MKLFEIIEDYGKGIFAVFAENFPMLFETLFNGFEVATLDNLVKFRHGNKTVLESVSRENFPDIIKAVISINAENWEKAHTAIITEYSVKGDETETKTKSGTVDRNTANTQTTLNAEKVFNDTEFVDAEKANTDTANNTMETYDLTETNIKTVGNVLDNIRKEYLFRRETNLQNDIAYAIVSEITLQIYV